MTLQDCIIRALNDFMMRSPPNVNHDPTKFGGHRHCSNGDINVLVCHDILQGDVIKGSFDFIGRGHQSELTPLHVW